MAKKQYGQPVVTFRADPALVDALDAMAAREGITRSDAARMLMATALDHEETAAA